MSARLYKPLTEYGMVYLQTNRKTTIEDYESKNDG